MGDGKRKGGSGARHGSPSSPGRGGAKAGRRGGKAGSGHGPGRQSDPPPARRPKESVTLQRPALAEAWTAVVAPNAVNLVTVGHPWLYSGALAALDAPTGGDHEPGGLALVLGPDGRPLAVGQCNPQSQIAIRLLGRLSGDVAPSSLPSLATLVQERLERAAALRRALGRPAPDRTAWRLINAEGDLLPGLTIDRVADGASVLVSTAGARRMVEAAAEWLLGSGGCAWVSARVAGDAHPSEALPAGTLLQRGDVPAEVEVVHAGARYLVDPLGGQKGGIYTDQLDNHTAVAALAQGRFVVDAYCHHGGFGIHAARAGARRVLAIDASQRAVEATVAAAARSGVADRVEAVCGDAIHLLGDLAMGLGAEAGAPELIIVDPPKFVTRADVLEDGLRKYTHLNATAMAALAPGGLLVTCSCSGRVDRVAFLRMLGHAARRAGRELQLLELRGAAADHPTAPVHAEAQYLKVAICRVV